IMCVAKARANGLPIGPILARHTVMQRWSAGEHGSTYGGNAVACAAAGAVIETMVRERIAERAATLGQRVLARARGWQAAIPQLADVRGLGLMIGLEFMQEGRPAADLGARMQDSALRRGVLVLKCGLHDNG